MKYLILLSFLGMFGFKGNAQEYEKINQYILAEHLKDDVSTTSMTILYSLQDCDKCIMYLHGILKAAEESAKSTNPIIINVITDNLAYAKKYLGKYNLKYKYFFDKGIFSDFGINSRTLIYINNHSNLITEPQDIVSFLGTEKKQVVYQVIDSLMTPQFMVSVALPHQSFFTFDNKMRIGLLIKKKKENYSTIKLISKLNDSLKLYNLPDRVNHTDFKKIPLKSFQNMLNQFNLEFLKIESFSTAGNKVYCSFSINRFYKDMNETGNHYGMFTNNFIAVKDLNNVNDLDDIMNLDTYEQIYFVDFFDFEGDIYPMGAWIGSNLKILNTNKIAGNVNVIDSKTDNIQFGGLATLELDKVTQKISMINIDRNAEEIMLKPESRLNVNGNTYILQKIITDEINNSGPIQLIKE